MEILKNPNTANYKKNHIRISSKFWGSAPFNVQDQTCFFPISRSERTEIVFYCFWVRNALKKQPPSITLTPNAKWGQKWLMPWYESLFCCIMESPATSLISKLNRYKTKMLQLFWWRNGNITDSINKDVYKCGFAPTCDNCCVEFLILFACCLSYMHCTCCHEFHWSDISNL